MIQLQNLINVIKERRKVLNLTQEDLAGIAGVSLRTLKAVESGKGNPSLETILKILNTMGLSLKVEVNS